MFPDQASYYQHQISQMPQGGQMCEVGFGSGLSSLGYLRSNPNITLLTFDLWEDSQGRFGQDPYLKIRKEVGAEHLRSNFGDRWKLIKGDSRISIPEFVKQNPRYACDTIHIDGDHTRSGALVDLVFFQTLAKPLHTVLIDDLQFDVIQKAVQDFYSGLRQMDCYVTNNRDTWFLGRAGKKKATKYWCRLEFDLEWSVQRDPAFLGHFKEVTGMDLPEVFKSGNKFRGVNITDLKLRTIQPNGKTLSSSLVGGSGSGSGSGSDFGSSSTGGDSDNAPEAPNGVWGMYSHKVAQYSHSETWWSYMGPPMVICLLVCACGAWILLFRMKKIRIEISVHRGGS